MGASQSTSSTSAPAKTAPAPTSMALADVPVEELLAEVARRLECAKKPEKRLILIGAVHHRRRVLLSSSISENDYASSQVLLVAARALNRQGSNLIIAFATWPRVGHAIMVHGEGEIIEWGQLCRAMWLE